MTNTRFSLLQAFAGVILFVSGIACAQQVTISRDSTLYATPGTDGAVVAQVKQGASGEVIGRQGTWVNVKTGGGSGWMYSFNVTYPAGAGPSAAGAQSRRPSVTPTAGIRGLDKEDMKNAQFDGKQLDALDSFAGDAQSTDQGNEKANDKGNAKGRQKR